MHKLRDVKYYETMFELLAKQYELAKINEAKDSSTIQLLDIATPPDWKSKPKRAVITITGFLLGLIAWVFFAFIYESVRKSHAKDSGNRWRALSKALKSRDN